MNGPGISAPPVTTEKPSGGRVYKKHESVVERVPRHTSNVNRSLNPPISPIQANLAIESPAISKEAIQLRKGVALKIANQRQLNLQKRGIDGADSEVKVATSQAEAAPQEVSPKIQLRKDLAAKISDRRQSLQAKVSVQKQETAVSEVQTKAPDKVIAPVVKPVAVQPKVVKAPPLVAQINKMVARNQARVALQAAPAPPKKEAPAAEEHEQQEPIPEMIQGQIFAQPLPPADSGSNGVQKQEDDLVSHSRIQKSSASGAAPAVDGFAEGTDSQNASQEIAPSGEVNPDIQAQPEGPHHNRDDPNLSPESGAESVNAKADTAYLQKSESGNGQTGTAALQSELNSSKGQGSPLPKSERGFFESRMGADFSNVRIHTGPKAEQLNQGLGAHAFAHGGDIYFNSGKYQPGTSQGRHLLAHELTHTIQQGSSPSVDRKAESEDGDAVQKSESEEADSVQKSEDAEASPGAVQAKASCSGCESAAPELVQTKCAACEAKEQVSASLQSGSLIPQISRTVQADSEIQPSLKIGQPGDKYEQEADSVADTVMQMPDNAVQPSASRGTRSGKACISRTTYLTSTPGKVIQGGWFDSVTSAIGSGIRRLGDLAASVKAELLGRAAAFARNVPGYGLLTVVLGRDPISDQTVPRNATTVVGGFMQLIGQQEKFDQLVESGALQKGWDWLQGELGQLNLNWGELRGMFTEAWEGLSPGDILHPVAAFNRIVNIFRPLITRLRTFAVNVGTKVIELVFEGFMGGGGGAVIAALKRAGGLFLGICRDPMSFLGNLVNAVKLGLRQFGGNILTHLRNGLITWLTGGLASAGLQLPAQWNFQGILSVVMQVLGLTYDRIRPRLVTRIGERAVGILETGFELVRILVTEGPAGLWQQLMQRLDTLQQTIIEGIRNFVIQRIIMAAVTRLASMFNPVGAFVQAILAIYNTVTFVMAQMSRLTAFVNSVVNSIGAIASGNIGGAASFIEQSLGRAVPLVIDFMARLIGLGDIAAPVRRIMTAVQSRVDRAVDGVLDWVMERGRAMLARFRRGREAMGPPPGGVSPEDERRHRQYALEIKDQLDNPPTGPMEWRPFVESKRALATRLEGQYAPRIAQGTRISIRAENVNERTRHIRWTTRIAPNTTTQTDDVGYDAARSVNYQANVSIRAADGGSYSFPAFSGASRDLLLRLRQLSLGADARRAIGLADLGGNLAVSNIMLSGIRVSGANGANTTAVTGQPSVVSIPLVMGDVVTIMTSSTNTVRGGGMVNLGGTLTRAGAGGPLTMNATARAQIPKNLQLTLAMDPIARDATMIAPDPTELNTFLSAAFAALQASVPGFGGTLNFDPRDHLHSEQGAWQVIRLKDAEIAGRIRAMNFSRLTDAVVNIHTERDMCRNCALSSNHMGRSLVSYAPATHAAITSIEGGVRELRTIVTSTFRFSGRAMSYANILSGVDPSARSRFSARITALQAKIQQVTQVRDRQIARAAAGGTIGATNQARAQANQVKIDNANQEIANCEAKIAAMISAEGVIQAERPTVTATELPEIQAGPNPAYTPKDLSNASGILNLLRFGGEFNPATGTWRAFPSLGVYDPVDGPVLDDPQGGGPVQTKLNAGIIQRTSNPANESIQRATDGVSTNELSQNMDASMSNRENPELAELRSLERKAEREGVEKPAEGEAATPGPQTEIAPAETTPAPQETRAGPAGSESSGSPEVQMQADEDSEVQMHADEDSEVQMKCAECKAQEQVSSSQNPNQTVPYISRTASEETDLQPSLKIGQPGDKFEQEADSVADQVMQGPPSVQKSEDEEVARPSLLEAPGIQKEDDPDQPNDGEPEPGPGGDKEGEQDSPNPPVDPTSQLPPIEDAAPPPGKDVPAGETDSPAGEAKSDGPEGTPDQGGDKSDNAPKDEPENGGKPDSSRGKSDAGPKQDSGTRDTSEVGDARTAIETAPNPFEQAAAVTQMNAIEVSSEEAKQAVDDIHNDRQATVSDYFNNFRRLVSGFWDNEQDGLMVVAESKVGEIQARIEGAIESVSTSIQSYLEKGEEIIHIAAETITGFIEGALDTVTNLVEGIGEGIADIVNDIPLPNIPGLGTLRGWISQAIRKATGLVTSALEAVTSMITGVLDRVKDVLRQITTMLREAIGTIIQKVAAGIRAIMRELVQFIWNAVRLVISKVSRLINSKLLPAIEEVEGKVHTQLEFYRDEALSQIEENRIASILIIRRMVNPEPADRGPPDCSRPISTEEKIRIMEEIAQACQERNTQIVESFANITETVLTSVFAKVEDLIQSVLDQIRQIPARLWQAIQEAVASVFQDIQNLASDIITNLGNALSELKTTLTDLAGKILEWVKSVATELLTWAKNLVSQIFNYVKDYIKGIVTSVGSFLGLTSATASFPGAFVIASTPGPIFLLISGLVGIVSVLVLAVVAAIGLLITTVLRVVVTLLSIVMLLILAVLLLILSILELLILAFVILVIAFLLTSKRAYKKRRPAPPVTPAPLPLPAPGPCPVEDITTIPPSGQWGPDFYFYSRAAPGGTIPAGGSDWLDYQTNCAEEARLAHATAEDYLYVSTLPNAQADGYIDRGQVRSQGFRSIIYEMDVSANHYANHTPVPAEAYSSHRISITGPDCGDPSGGDPGGGPQEEADLEKCDRGELPPDYCEELRQRIIRRFGNKDRDLNIDPDAPAEHGSPRPEDVPISETYRLAFNRLDSWVIFIHANHPEWDGELNGPPLNASPTKSQIAADLYDRTTLYKQQFRDLNATDAAEKRQEYIDFLDTKEAEIKQLNLDIALWYKGKTGHPGTLEEIIEQIHGEGTEIWRELWEQKIFEVNRIFARLWPPAKSNILNWIAGQRSAHPGIDLDGTVSNITYIGSTSRGTKGPPKQFVRFNPMNFDVDANFFAPPLVKYVVRFQGTEPDRQKIFSRDVDLPPVAAFVNEAQVEFENLEGFTSRELFDVAIWAPESETQRRTRSATVRLYSMRDGLPEPRYQSLKGDLQAENLLVVTEDGLAVKEGMTSAEFDSFNEICDRYKDEVTISGRPAQDGSGQPGGTGGSGNTDQGERQGSGSP